MMKHIIITNLANSDIAKGRDWHESKEQNLGFKFMNHVYNSV
jgi:hypothetical protein